MTWTTPTTRTTGEKITDSIYNVDLVENLKELYNARSYYACIADVKANGVSGGTFTSGAWRTRDLNTEIFDPQSIVSIAANQFILQAGTYIIHAPVPGHAVNIHKARLQNITGGTTTLMGSSVHSVVGSVVTTQSLIWGGFTIAIQTTFEIQHQCATTQATIGFGQASSFGVDEVYTIVNLWKITS